MSDDNRLVVLNDDTHIYLFDIVDKAVLWTKTRARNFNWAGVSRGGGYVVIVNAKTGQPNNERTKTCYDIQGNQLWQINGSEHDDFQYLFRDGQWLEVLVAEGEIPYAWVLSTGEVIALGPENTWMYGHVSGRGPRGKIYCSVHTSQLDSWANWSIGEYDIAGGVEANTQWSLVEHSRSLDYVNQMKATVSPSGRYMIYTSDKDGVANDYLVERVVE